MYSSLKPSTKPMKRGTFKKLSADHARLRRQRKGLKGNSVSIRQLSKWSKDVRERDNHICQRCGGVGEVAHHVAPRSRRPDLRLDRENGKTLCSPCHTWIHDHVKQATEAGWLSDVPYEMRDEIRVDTEKLAA